MGALLSKQKSDPNDYEQILSELDEKIQKAEVRLSEIKIRERRTGVLWIIYGTIAWAAFLLYSFISLHDSESVDWNFIMTLLPVLVIPLGIYYTRRLLKWFYTRKQTNEEANLAALRAQQKLKVEELKKKTSYYTTKSLLERYDLAAAQKKKQEQEQAQRNGQATARATARQQPGQPGQLRQRNGGPGPGPLPPQQKGQGMMHPQQQQQQRQNGLAPNHGAVAGGGVGVPRQPMQQQQQQPRERQWYDKLVDALVGEEGPETKYALICRHCFTHNGLVLPQEIDYIQYTCPNCKQFNPARKMAVAPPSPTPPSSTPSQQPQQQQQLPSDENKTENGTEPISPEMRQVNGKTHHEQEVSPVPEAEPYEVPDEDNEKNDVSNNIANTEEIKAS